MGTASDVVAALQDFICKKRPRPADAIKDFNLLLNSRDQDVSANLPLILETFQPSTPLGKLLRLKLIGRYKVSSEVWTLLQSDDSLQIKQVLKFDWFFLDVEDPKNFVRNVIPNLSLSTRLKIINKYASYLKNTTAGKSIYIDLKNRYGIKTAVPILPACEVGFVRRELPNLAVLLPPSVLMILLDKYQSVATEYIQFLVSENSSRKQKNLSPYKCVFVKLSKKDTNSFIELFNKHDKSFPSMRLGRRPLKKAIRNHFESISKSFNKFDELLRHKQFFHRLSLEQIKTLYVSSLLPSTSSAFFGMLVWDDPYRFLDYVKPSVRSDIANSTFKLKYKQDHLPSDILQKCRLDSLAYLPIEAKIDWVNLKVPEMNDVQDEARAVAHLPVETSLPRLKQLITAQSDGAVRAEVAKQMVKTLKLNQCSSGIKDLAEYFVARFRNETKGFRQTVVSEMGLLEELLLKMDWEDWPSIYKFIDLIKLNDEIPNCQGGLRKIYTQLIHACFLRKLDLDPYLRGYVEFERTANERVRSSLFEVGKGTPYHRWCIEWFLAELPNLKIKYTDDGPYPWVSMDLMETVIDYNVDHKLSKIELPDWLIKDVERKVSSDCEGEYYVLSIFNLLTKNKNIELRDRLILKHFPKYSDCGILCRLVKKTPDVILSNLDFLINKMLNDNYCFCHYNCFIKKCKLYDDIRAEMVKAGFAALDQAEKTNESDEYQERVEIKINAIKVLAELMEPSLYLEFSLNCMPAGRKINEFSKEVQVDLAIQRAICKTLSRTSIPMATLPVLRKFGGGNCLKIFCGSVMGVCVRIPENIILPILEEWFNCPLSLRKQTLRLMYCVAPIKFSMTAFENLFNAEKKTSVRFVLFLKIRETFIANPNADLYNTLLSILHKLEEDDREILDTLFDINIIPDSYLSQYVELLWELVDSKWLNVLPNAKSKVVDAVDQKVIKLLSNDVCDSLLTHELSEKLPKQPLTKYICHYLLCSDSDDVQRHRLDIVMSALEPHVKLLWNVCERTASGYVFILRHLISDIVESLCAESLNTGDFTRAASVLYSMKNALLSLVELRDLLKECIQLDAYALYLDLKGSGQESTYASALAELYNSYIQQYNADFGYALLRHLISDIPMVSNMEFAHELLKNHSHPTCHVVATKILKCKLSEEDLPLYKTIAGILSSSNHPHVQAAASDYFRSLDITTV